MGWTLIPILSQPTNYYYSFVVIGMLLAVRRPRIGVVVLLTSLAFSVNGLLFYRTYEEYFYASVITVVACFTVAVEMARAPSEEPG